MLAASVDRVVPTDELLDRVWTDADGADPSYLWVTVRRLRRKLEADPDRPRYLLTERGIGYRLTSGASGASAGLRRSCRQPGLWLRVFVALLLAVLPPILLLAGALLLHGVGPEPSCRSGLSWPSSSCVGSIAWAAILGVVYSRTLARRLPLPSLSLARARRAPGRRPRASATPIGQLANTLDERNRQVATLARQASTVPIDEDAASRSSRPLVSAVRSVMRDSTWRCAVLAVRRSGAAPAGRLSRRGEDADSGSDRGSRAVGIRVDRRGQRRPRSRVRGARSPSSTSRSSDRLRAILYAPWEGRVEPSPAEIDLLTLVGQHAARPSSTRCCTHGAQPRRTSSTAWRRSRPTSFAA